MAKLNIKKRQPGEMPTAQEWNQLVTVVESMLNATGQNMFIDSTGVHTRPLIEAPSGLQFVNDPSCDDSYLCGDSLYIKLNPTNNALSLSGDGLVVMYNTSYGMTLVGGGLAVKLGFGLAFDGSGQIAATTSPRSAKVVSASGTSISADLQEWSGSAWVDGASINVRCADYFLGSDDFDGDVWPSFSGGEIIPVFKDEDGDWYPSFFLCDRTVC